MREPLFHIAKRDVMVWWKAWLIRFCAIALSLLVCALLTFTLTGLSPFNVFVAMFKGAVSTRMKRWAFLEGTAVLLVISLAVTPAFRMRFWNIGAEGQVLVGALATATVMLFLGGKVPNGVLFILMLAAAVLAGLVWGIIPAAFKAKWNTNETLFTLMMNYVALQIVNYCVYQWSVPKGSGAIGVINLNTGAGWLPKILGESYFLIIAAAVILTAVLYIYLNYSKHGYEIAVVGESENTARYIGINVKKVVMRTMILSGALCGLAGFLIVSGADHTVTPNTVGGQGFTAIMVSWLAKFNPAVMILKSALIVFLQKGSGEISTRFGLNKSFADILTGIIILFIIGCEFFINYRIIFNKRHQKGDQV